MTQPGPNTKAPGTGVWNSQAEEKGNTHRHTRKNASSSLRHTIQASIIRTLLYVTSGMVPANKNVPFVFQLLFLLCLPQETCKRKGDRDGRILKFLSPLAKSLPLF